VEVLSGLLQRDARWVLYCIKGVLFLGPEDRMRIVYKERGLICKMHATALETVSSLLILLL
jgi:hypothetical protein